jgi:hypothetical protein
MTFANLSKLAEGKASLKLILLSRRSAIAVEQSTKTLMASDIA